MLSSDQDGCVRWCSRVPLVVVLFASHIFVALLALCSVLPYLPRCRPSASRPSTTSMACMTLLPNSTGSSLFDVCGEADQLYPVSYPDSIRRFCNGAAPSQLSFGRSSRYTRHDLAAVLLTVDGYKHDRDEAVLHSWLTPTRWPAAYFATTIDRPAEMLQPTLHIPNTGDGYISNLNKTWLSLYLLYQRHPDKAWYLQTSNDAYVDIDSLLLKLDPYDSTEVLYVGGSVAVDDCWLTGRQIPYIEGGAGFLVSNGLMKRYGKQIESWTVNVWMSEEGRRHNKTMFGDLMVGCFMDERGIAPTHIEGGHNQVPAGVTSWSFDPDFPSTDQRWWAWHYVHADDQLDVDLLFALQRVDQLEAHRQWSELLLYTRQLLVEHHEQQTRSLQLLDNWRTKRDKFTSPGIIQSQPTF